MAHIDEDTTQYSTNRTYGRGIVEEATQWGQRPKFLDETTTPSESASSELTNSDSTRSGDLAGMFRFAPDDKILVVDDNSDIRKFLRTM